MRAVKKNPRVISKRWFLKKASLVSFSLPSTIRLDQAAGQTGQHESDYPRSRAILDLGPSLGTRTIPLSGVLHANINFNDAFDGGHLGDVRITLPPDPSAKLSTTSVPLLTNPNTTNSATKASQNEIDKLIVTPTGGPVGSYTAGDQFSFVVDNGSIAGGVYAGTGPTVTVTLGSNGAACINTISPSPALAQCDGFARQIAGQIAALANIGTGNVYVVAANNAIATGGVGSPNDLLVQMVFVGGLNQKTVGGIGAGGLGTVVPTNSTQAQKATYDAQDMGGCGSWDGNGTAQTLSPLRDIDAPNRLLGKNGADSLVNPNLVATGANTPGNDSALGDGSLSPDPAANPGDVVLRTGALSLNVAVPTTSAEVPGDIEDNPGSTLGAAYTVTGAASQVLTVTDIAPFTSSQSITLTDGFSSATGSITNVDPTNSQITVTWAAPVPTTGTLYAKESAVFVNSNGVVKKSVGTSGGRANLFGQPINGLAKGNSVDVTVNLATDIHSIAREVDGNRPAPFGASGANAGFITNAGTVTTLNVTDATGVPSGASISIGPSQANLGFPTQRRIVSATGAGTITVTSPVTVVGGEMYGYTPETNGNISAYFNCRQAWTGSVRNYLTGIKLVGALRISPAVTADGKVRIAKVNLRTPSPVPEALAACLSPYQLYMAGNPLASDFAFPALTPATGHAPGLFLGAEFNPLVVLSGSQLGPSNKPSAKCNAAGGPLDREPFNTGPQAGGATDLSTILSKGAAVGVSGTLTTTIKADVIIGTFPN